ncbi:MAG: NAD(P)/FAD-dependent oxidoreductase [Pseudomonadales bacterium]
MREKIVILGAGPAGLLLARLLLESEPNSDIHVFERADALQDRENEKSFSFAIFKRGFDALAQISGLDETVSRRCVLIEERMRNWMPPAVRRNKVKEPFRLCERNELIQCLLDSLEELNSERFHIHFGAQCTDVDLQQKEVHFSMQGQNTIEAYDLLFGADGAGSRLRQVLERDADFACEDKPYSRVYRNFYLDKNGRDQLSIGPNELHAWLLPGGLMVGAIPNPNGTATCNLVFAASNEETTNAGHQWSMMEKSCPEVVAAVPEDERKAFLERKILQCRTIKLDRYHFENHACLLGDAAHAVPPSVGQGCNSSLEDAVIIARLLKQFSGDRGKALEAYTASRVPDMHALLRLSIYAMPLEPKLRKRYETKIRINEALRSVIPGLKPANLLDYLAGSVEPFSQTLKRYDGWIEKVESSNLAFIKEKQAG